MTWAIRAIAADEAACLLDLNAQVQAIHVEVHPHHYRADPDPDALLAFLRDQLSPGGATALVAFAPDGAALGYLIFDVEAREATPLVPARRLGRLEAIAVDGAHRRAGIGSALVAEMMARLRAEGVLRVRTTYGTFNSASAALMRKAGLLPFMITAEGPTSGGDGLDRGPPSPEETRMEIADPDPAWPAQAAAVAAEVAEALGPALVAIEHLGSTAVPGLPAKPVLDLMAAAVSLPAAEARVLALKALGLEPAPTDMTERLFLRRPARDGAPAVHLHVVTAESFPRRKERRFRDRLRDHPEEAAAYGALKRELAARFGAGGEAYTRAKTALIQEIMDRDTDARGLPREDVWE